MRGKRISRGHQDAQLLAALDEEGCPVCHLIAGSDDHYLFWFFNENYYEPFSLDGLTRSLGFCLAHGARLTRSSVGAYQLAAVHEVLVRRIREMLLHHPAAQRRGEGPRPALATYDVCPACQDRESQAARTAFWLAALLEEPGGADRYACPGILCFPHLRAVLPRVSQVTFERLLAVHESAMACALQSLRELTIELGPIASEGRQDLVKALLPSLRLALGHDKGNGAYPVPHESGVSPRSRDPVGDFLEALGRGEACPVCLPVCERLAVARDRALSLLFGLLEGRQHRATLESGYGLCLKHFSRTLAFHPAPAIRSALVEVEAAKLARLHWELEESLRKVAWNVRPEPKGTEQTAWRRAVLRFSGSLKQRAG